MGTGGSRGPSGQLPLRGPAWTRPRLCSLALPVLSPSAQPQQGWDEPSPGLGVPGERGGVSAPPEDTLWHGHGPASVSSFAGSPHHPEKRAGLLTPKPLCLLPLPHSPVHQLPLGTGQGHLSIRATWPVSPCPTASRLPSSSPALDAWFWGSNPGPIYTGS